MAETGILALVIEDKRRVGEPDPRSGRGGKRFCSQADGCESTRLSTRAENQFDAPVHDPALPDSLVETCGALLELSLEQRALKADHHIASDLRQMASDLGSVAPAEADRLSEMFQDRSTPQTS